MDEKGFTYFTHYSSDKVKETEQVANASLTFFWRDLERQVRVEGVVEKVTDKESDDYFMNRPLGSRLGAWASPQSSEIANREELIKNVEQVKIDFEGKEVVRPKNWGGLRLVPTYFEFWQGRPSRLHDRLCYTLVDGVWTIERLSP